MSVIGDRLKDAVAALLGVSAYQPYKGFGPELDDPAVKQTRESLGGQIQPLPQTKLRWYLADLETAQRQADSGNIAMASQLYRAMRRDGVLHGLLGARAAGLVRLPKKFYGDAQISDALRFGNGSRAVFDELMPPAETGMIIEDGIVLGVSVAELVPVGGREYPVAVRLEPEFLQFRWHENRWYFHSIAGVLPITPGDGRWVLHIPGARMSPWHFGLWPALGRSFINKEHALMHRANYSAKLANPARAAVAPKGAVEEERRGFLRRLIQWGVNTVFELPPGWDVKIIESNGRGYDVFQREIDTSDHEYMVALAGQEVTTTGGAGFSNAEFPYRIREDLTEQDGESLAYTVNTQVLPSYIASNFGGPESITTRATNVQWETGRPKELKDQADTLLKTAQAIVALKQALDAAGRTLDIDAICERFAVALESEEKASTRSDAPAEKAPAAPTLTATTPGVKPAGESTPEGKAAAARLGFTPTNGHAPRAYAFMADLRWVFAATRYQHAVLGGAPGFPPLLPMPSASIAADVTKQLERDYPADSLGWVKDLTWHGPMVVPLDHINFDNQAQWRAYREDLKDFIKRIEQGQLKPIVLVQKPGQDRLRIVDGHHRALAYAALQRDPVAYYAEVPAVDGPWDTLHAAQQKTPSGPIDDSPTSSRLSGAEV